MAVERATSVVREAMYEAREAEKVVNREVIAAEELALRSWETGPPALASKVRLRAVETSVKGGVKRVTRAEAGLELTP
jgi:ribosomal protein L31E